MLFLRLGNGATSPILSFPDRIKCNEDRISEFPFSVFELLQNDDAQNCSRRISFRYGRLTDTKSVVKP
jgi:hypothetical protein